MKAFYLIFFLTITGFQVAAQECGNCGFTPSLASFDADVQMPKPADTGIAMLRWRSVFNISRLTHAQLFEQNKHCIKFTQPPSSSLKEPVILSDGIELPSLVEEEADMMKVGETYTNLPPPGDVSRLGDYILTGTVTGTEDNYTIRIEVQAACNRKVAASAQATFKLGSIPSESINIAGNLATQLSPLIDKIKKFELEERNQDKKLALTQIGWTPIKVTPAKKSLKPGESTQVIFELKDCDGVPLEGRELIFTASSFEGFALHATEGGIVSPAKVITDAQGKAVATFKMNANAKQAVINAHSLGNHVKGCSNAFTGSGFIFGLKSYSGHIRYSYENKGNCKRESESGCSKNTSKGTQESRIVYLSSFADRSDHINDVQLQFSGDEGDRGPNAPGNMEAGTFTSRKKDIQHHVIICESVNKNEKSIQRIFDASSGRLKYGSGSFLFSDKRGIFSLNMVFNVQRSHSFDQTHLQSANSSGKEETTWSFDIDTEYNKEFVFVKTTRAGKSTYSITGTRSTNHGCGINSTEKISFVVTED